MTQNNMFPSFLKMDIIRVVTLIICILNFSAIPINSIDIYTVSKSSLETYIVHVEAPEAELDDMESWHHSFLPTTSRRMMYSYRSVFQGFAARLSPEEVNAMAKVDGFISARPERKLSLQTTHSPNFLGLNENMGLWEHSNYGRGVIIGVLDTGIFPDHPSFSDVGMPPPPARWKGKCEFKYQTACNNKIIGARYFNRRVSPNPLDDVGHGTHAASIAAGNFVKGANVLGSANGTASGIAPLAHLAIYKVCSRFTCLESDILAAIEAAIEDGVDILSISLSELHSNFYDDIIARGAFSAMEKGILVSAAAGNTGPSDSTITNGAPWILTVGATTTDRKIRVTAVLGNNQTVDGESAFQPIDFPPTQLLSVVYAGSLNTSDPELPFCIGSSLSKVDIQGKVVVCELGHGIKRIEQGRAVKDAGGAAMIVMNSQQYANTTFAEAHVLPATHVSYADGLKIRAYINSTSTPVVTIVFKGTIIGDSRAPAVAAFSSRGPNSASRGILKPDIIGPGVNVIAAWPVSAENKNTNSAFNILSGTSMSCPHLSGVSALLKSAHPDWSPAAIKSAIMTTADMINFAQNPIEDERDSPTNIFATGSGHVNPSRATDPGLVYDIRSEDYVRYLCGLHYTDHQVDSVIQRKVDCSEESSIPEGQLNYPSFALTFSSFQSSPQTYTRTLTNVGEPNSSYDVEIVAPPGIDVHVEPSQLHFSEINQKLQYSVTFRRSAIFLNNEARVQGLLTWKSSRYSVRSPIAVMLG